jgi:hypothetical protein
MDTNIDNPLLELFLGKPHYLHSETCGNYCEYSCNPSGFEQAEEIKKALGDDSDKPNDKTGRGGLDWEIVFNDGEWQIWTPDFNASTGAIMGSGKTELEARADAVVNLEDLCETLLRMSRPLVGDGSGKALPEMCKGEDAEICPECHHRLRCEEDRDVDTGVCSSTWLECPNCHYKGSVMEPLPLAHQTSPLEPRACLRCHCTDDCACDTGPNTTCSWVCESVDICSACVPAHLAPLFKEIRLLEEMMEGAGIVLSARVDAAHALLKGEVK